MAEWYGDDFRCAHLFKNLQTLGAKRQCLFSRRRTADFEGDFIPQTSLLGEQSCQENRLVTRWLTRTHGVRCPRKEIEGFVIPIFMAIKEAQGFQGGGKGF